MRFCRNIHKVLIAAVLITAGRTPTIAQGIGLPADVTALFEDIMDIDKLRVLNPLKLKSEQIDKMIAVIQKSQDNYNRKLAAAGLAIKDLSSEIKETRTKMMGGAAIPTDLDDKVKKLQDKFVEQRNKLEKDTLQGMSTAMTSVFTSDQKASAVALAKKALNKEGKPTTKGSDDNYFNYYVLQVFIQYPRAISLLKDIKGAKESARSPGISRVATANSAGKQGPRP